MNERTNKPMKQEPVVDLSKLRHEDKCCYWEDEEFCNCGADSHEILKWYRQNYAAPVDAKAIRAEALEEAAKVCDDEQAQLEAMGLDDEAWAAGYCARQIRGLI